MTMNSHPTPTEPLVPPGRVVVQAFAQTDVGRAREHNEDAFLVADLSSGQVVDFGSAVPHSAVGGGTLFMVADGMGGAAAGEIASATAVDVVLRVLQEEWADRQEATGEEFVKTLRHATEVANGTIYQFALEHPEFRGMGTTATIAGLLGDTLYLAQVGDSRAYLIRDGVARQITKDQSLMQKLIEAGEISEEEAATSDRRNIILQALGPEANIKIDLTHQRVRRGDVLVLCSDGLSGLVRPEQIAQVAREEPDLAGLCDRLICLANDMGGPDNITVVAARFAGDGLEPASAGEEVGHRRYQMIDGTPLTPATAIPSAMRVTDPMGARVVRAPAIPVVDEERRRRGQLYIRVLAGLGTVLALVIAWRLVMLAL